MLNNDLETITSYTEIKDNDESSHENNKITLVGLRKSIIVCQDIDGLYEILVYMYLTKYYFFASLLYCVLFWNTINLYKNNLPFYLFSILIKLSIKVTMLCKVKSVFINIITCSFLLFNIFWFKIAYLFYNTINYEINDSDIESINSGWRPRIINFVY